jgi:c(7)-type cytochrome triheme protein
MAIKKMTKRGVTMKKVLIMSLVALSATFILSSALFAGDVFHGGDTIYTKPVKAVIFSHKVHVEDIGYECGKCHDSLFEMQSLKAQENEDFTMQGLYDGKYCGACHAVFFSHKLHVQDKGLGCSMCHEGLSGRQKAPKSTKSKIDSLVDKDKSCGNCHDVGAMAFASDTQCARCHIGVKGYNEMTGEGGGGSGH